MAMAYFRNFCSLPDRLTLRTAELPQHTKFILADVLSSSFREMNFTKNVIWNWGCHEKTRRQNTWTHTCRHKREYMTVCLHEQLPHLCVCFDGIRKRCFHFLGRPPNQHIVCKNRGCCLVSFSSISCNVFVLWAHTSYLFHIFTNPGSIGFQQESLEHASGKTTSITT